MSYRSLLWFLRTITALNLIFVIDAQAACPSGPGWDIIMTTRGALCVHVPTGGWQWPTGFVEPKKSREPRSQHALADWKIQQCISQGITTARGCAEKYGMGRSTRQAEPIRSAELTQTGAPVQQ